MRGIFLVLLLSIAFLNFSSSRVTNNNINDNDLTELKYPPPIDLSNLFPFRTLRTLFNLTLTNQTLENETNRLGSQMTSVFGLLRRIFRFMIQNALAISPLRSTTTISTTEKFNDDDEKVSIDLPVFETNDNDETESTTNNVQELN